LPLLSLGILVLALAGAVGWLFLERGRLAEDLSGVNQALAGQEQATNKAETDHAAMTTDRDTEKARAGGEKTRADTAEEALVERDARVENLTADLVTNETKIAELNAEISRLKTEIEAAAQAAADAKTPNKR